MRAAAVWGSLGLLIGFTVCFYREHRDEVLAARRAEGTFQIAVAQYEALGPNFGQEDHLGPILAALDAECAQVPAGQRLEERVGEWLASKGRHAEATYFFLRGLARYPSRGLAERASLAATVAGDLDAATEAYGAWIRLDPRNPQPLNSLGYLYALEGVQLEEAERLIGQALSMVGPADVLTRAAFLDSLAWVRHRQGRDREAAGMMQEVMQLLDRAGVGVDPVVRQHQTEILAALGRARAPGPEAAPEVEAESAPGDAAAI